MQCVGHHLQIEAIRLHQVSESNADFFARSAFNRYYYATFLHVRNTLLEIDPKYDASLNHKGIPDILRGTIHRRIGALRKKASKIGDSDLVKECHRAISQNLSFASNLEKAYAIRVAADYMPNAKIDFRHDRFILSGVPVTEAHNWLDKASIWSAVVQRIMVQENG